MPAAGAASGQLASPRICISRLSMIVMIFALDFLSAFDSSWYYTSATPSPFDRPAVHSRLPPPAFDSNFIHDLIATLLQRHTTALYHCEGPLFAGYGVVACC